ncbi:MAG: hypothetical protein NW223_21025 [Hyphomicrobiaceae bacterium]|nr:hypothetical protein [Hyphomicrobiaceae bacterium]
MLPTLNDLYFILGLAAAAVATYAIGLRKIPALFLAAALLSVVAVSLRAMGVRI